MAPLASYMAAGSGSACRWNKNRFNPTTKCSVAQRLERANHAGNACALAQLREQRARGIGVSFAGIGRIGPNSVVNNLRRFLYVHVQCRFAYIHTLLEPVIAGLADGSRFGFRRV